MMRYKHHQLLWDLHHLSFYCSDCKCRILVGIFPTGFKTSLSEYQSLLSEIILKHEFSYCKFTNAHGHNAEFKEYVRLRQVRSAAQQTATQRCRAKKYNTASNRAVNRSRTKYGRFSGLPLKNNRSRNLNGRFSDVLTKISNKRRCKID